MGKQDRNEQQDERIDDGAEQAVDQEESPLQQVERERDELRALWQRSQADYQNLKRRQLGDVEAAVRSARSNLLSELLVVLDYLDMALATPVTSEEARNLRVGVEMTRQQFWHSLERQGVSSVTTEGLFDATLHQAVATLETDEHEPGTILEVVRKGYRLPELVLRHAQVKVATPSSLPDPPDRNLADS